MQHISELTRISNSAFLPYLQHQREARDKMQKGNMRPLEADEELAISQEGFWNDEFYLMRENLSRLSRARLNYINRHLPRNKSSDIMREILDVYSGSAKSDGTLDKNYVKKLVYSLVAKDVLVTSMINKYGGKTEFASDYEHKFDPTIYEVAQAPWAQVYGWMGNRLAEHGRKVFTTSAFEPNSGAIIDVFLSTFGEDSLITLPKKLDIDKNGITITPALEIPDPKDLYPYGMIFFCYDLTEKNPTLF